MAYDLVQQLTAVKIYEASGESRLAAAVLSEIRATIGADVSAPTVRNWIKKHGGKENFQEEKKETSESSEKASVRQRVSLELAAKCEQAAHAYLDHAVKPDIVKKATGPSAMTAAAIAIDKRHKLLGLDNQTITVLIKVIDALEQRDLSPGEVFGVMLQQLVNERQA